MFISSILVNEKICTGDLQAHAVGQIILTISLHLIFTNDNEQTTYSHRLIELIVRIVWRTWIKSKCV